MSWDMLLRADMAVIIVYITTMMVIGWIVSDGNRDAEGYCVGNRGMPAWLLGLSVLGTFTSSISFLAVPARCYSGNWSTYIFGLALPFSAFIATTWFVPLYRARVNMLSAYEFLGERFGYWARIYGMVSYLVLHIIRIATVMLLVGFAVQPLLELGHGDPAVARANLATLLVVLGVVVIIYDVMGGIRAVIWTDFLQVGVFLFGALSVLWTACSQLPEGPLQVLSMGIQENKFSLGEWFSWDPALATFFVLFIYGLTENSRNYGIDQDYVQRILAAKNEKAASRAIWVAAWSYIPTSAIFCMIGTALWAHYQFAYLPADVRANADLVYPYFIKNELSPALAGLVIAAVLAAAMSTIDSSLNSMSTVMLVDVVRPWRRGEPWLPEVVTLRLFTILFGTLGTSMAIWMGYRDDGRTILDVWWQYAGTAGGGLFGLFLLAWLCPRLPSWGAALAVATSVPVLTWGVFARGLQGPWAWLNCPFHANLIGAFATMVMVAIGLVIVWSAPDVKSSIGETSS